MLSEDPVEQLKIKWFFDISVKALGKGYGIDVVVAAHGNYRKGGIAGLRHDFWTFKDRKLFFLVKV